eukprot:9500871-Lingulodinium_polyedra.AAC.1
MTRRNDAALSQRLANRPTASLRNVSETCAKTRLKRCFAAATAHESLTRALHAETNNSAANETLTC